MTILPLNMSGISSWGRSLLSASSPLSSCKLLFELTVSRIAFLSPEEIEDWETHLFLSIIEFFFLIQFLMRFNTEFPHPETEIVIDDIKSISKY